MAESELVQRRSGGGWLWAALGCGALALVGLCLVPPAVVVLGWQIDDADDVDPIVVPPDPALEPSPPRDPVVPPGPGLPPPPPLGATSPRQVTVRITESSGVAAVRVGSTCTFEVHRHSRTDGTFWCQADIVCAGQTLYGGAGAGFFDCTLYEQPERHVVGEDFDTTSADRDGAMRLDTLRGELEVRDDARGRLGAFVVRGAVTGVR